MDSNLKNHTASAASGERLKGNNISFVSNCVKPWEYFWPLLILLNGRLLLVGRRVDIGTGLAVIAFLWLLIVSGSVQLNSNGSLATNECRETQVVVQFTSESTVPAYSHTDKSHICEIKPGVLHFTDMLPMTSSLEYEEKFIESNQLCDETASDSKANFQDEVNTGVLQKSNNVKNYASDVDLGDSSEHNNNLQVSNTVNFLKNNFWSLQGLLAFCIRSIWLGLEIRVALVVIMILGLGIPATSSPWFDIPVLMFIIAYSFMLFSLILQCTPRRQSQSHLLAGMAYTSAMLGILSIFVSLLLLEFACVLILIILLVLAALNVYSRQS